MNRTGASRYPRPVRGIFEKLKQHGLLAPLMKIGLGLVAIVVLLYGATWMANTGGDFDNALAEEPAAPTTSMWMAPTLDPPTSAPPPLPADLPSMEFPPPMVEAPEGEPQDVPTKFGLTYTVPGDDEWRPSNDGVMGWTREDGTDIAVYGSVSDYRYNYCADRNGATLADVGMTGRNGVDLDTAAREAVEKAGAIFSNGSDVDVRIRGPIQLYVSGRPAVRYTAEATGMEQKFKCDPTEATFDIVATPGYATAEVVTFMVKRSKGHEDSLSDEDVDRIIGSLRKTK